MKYDLFYLKRIQKKMTDTVKINVGFFLRYKNLFYWFWFHIFVIKCSKRKCYISIKVYKIYKGGGGERRPCGQSVNNLRNNAFTLSLFARLFLNPGRPTVTYFELFFILTPKHLPRDPSRRFRLCLHMRVSIGICIVVKHSWKWTGYCWY